MYAIVESASSETLKFHWKVSSEQYGDYLEFYIDGTRQDRISGEVDWTQKTYSISSGIHTLKWRYVKDSSGEAGDDEARVDFVQWSGAAPIPDSDNWQQLDFKYDVYGRRSEKLVDGYGTRYLYDGSQVIAEYDGNNNLLRKYIYGPGIDQPVSMIEVADNNAAYYYHYDALGSVIALSDSTGDTVQTYEYSVFGEPAVEDANHTNPYMFAGRRFDIEIGLYYNRARYYNPYTGRFLQTDPIGYDDGINWYLYCRNNPINNTDPSGLLTSSVTHPLAIPELIATEGLGAAIETFGTNATINWIIQTAGTSVAVSGMMVQLLPELIEPGEDLDPNVDPNSVIKLSKSFEEIINDPNLFEHWANRKKYPHHDVREYNEYEALRIIQNFENIYGEPPDIHPPHGDWDWHMHRQPGHGPHIPITKKAYDLLKSLGY